MRELQRLHAEHAAAVLAFEMANRAYFAAFISDRGDALLDHFDESFDTLLAEQEAGTAIFHVLVDEDDTVLGRFNLMEFADGTAVLGYRVAEHVAGHGVATATVARALRPGGDALRSAHPEGGDHLRQRGVAAGAHAVRLCSATAPRSREANPASGSGATWRPDARQESWGLSATDRSRSEGAIRDKTVTPMAMTQKATAGDDPSGPGHGEALVEDPDTQDDGDGGVDHDDQGLGHAQRADLQGGLLEHRTDDSGGDQRVEGPVLNVATSPEAASTSVVALMNAAIRAQVIEAAVA